MRSSIIHVCGIAVCEKNGRLPMESPDQLEDFYASRNILKRRVTTADVAASVEFLLSDRSSRTTGSVMTVDGGVAGAFPR